MKREDIVKRIDDYANMILSNDTKGCPDRSGGGCMGHCCTYCAARAIKGSLHEVDERINQLKRA